MRRQFARVPAAPGHPGGFLMVDDEGSVEFRPWVARAEGGAAWATRADGAATAQRLAGDRYGALDWHDVPDDEPDPVAWASLRSAVFSAPR